MSLHVLAAIYCSLGRFEEAVPVLERAIQVPDVARGADHALAAFSGYMQLGDTFSMLGHVDRSISCYDQGLQIQIEALGDTDPRVGETCRVMKSVDLSHIFGMSQSEPGILVVEFIFSIAWQLLDALLDDEGLLEFTLEKESRCAILYQEMEVDRHDNYAEKKTDQQEQLQNAKTVMAVEMIGQFLHDKISSRILYLACRN